MTSSRLEKSLRVASTVALGAVPCVIFLYSFETVFPFVVVKNVAFRLLVELAVALELALAIVRGRVRPRVTALPGAVLAFLLVLLAADSFGTDPYRSFFSTFERMEGFVGLAHLGAYFFALYAALDGEREGRRYLALCFGLAVLQGVWAVFQTREVGLLPSFRADARVSGTTGHPSFLAVHVAFLGFVGLFLAAGAKSRAGRLATQALSGFLFLVALLTGTRAVVLAVVVLGLFLFLRTTVFVEKRLSALSAASLVVLAIFAVVLVAESDVVSRDAPYLRGLKLTAEDDTAQARLAVWKIAGKGFLARPLLGWGQENFDQPFERFYDTRLLAVEPWFDRPHNVAFDWLLAGGIPALAAYLALFVAAFVTLRRAVGRGFLASSPALLLALALVSHLVALSFGVASLETWIPLFALLAVIAAFGKSQASSAPSSAKTPRRLLAAAVLLVWPAAASLHLPSLAQSAALRRAMSVDAASGKDEAMARWEEALR
ncbi:MAG TPA: O-antigen ligase family protein, partial [Thermoanaerobaculia bacterium]|nr:O-antigen ligase family protein [Thermoanaerobaculia bacterium]